MNNYTAPNYKAVLPVRIFSKVPHFTGKSTLSDLVEAAISDENLRSVAISYASRVIFVAGILIALWFVWIVMMLFLKCFRCGVSAGQRIVTQSHYLHPKKHQIFRWTMILSALILTATGIVYATVWVSRANDLYDDFDEGLDMLYAWVDEAVGSVDGIDQALVNITSTEAGTAYSDFDSFSQNVAYCNEIRTIATGVLSALAPIGAYDSANIQNIKDEFSKDVSNFMNDTDKIFEDTESIRIVSLANAIPILILGLLFLFGAFMSSRWSYNGYYRIQKWILNTLLFILVTIVLFYAAITSIVLTINSDACGGKNGPGVLIKNLLDSDLVELDDYTRSAVDYYILDGCQNSSFFILESITNLTDLVDEASDGLNSAFVAGDFSLCDNEDVQLFNASFQKLESHFDSLKTELGNIYDDMSCESINPIYIKFFHDGLCNSFPIALAWVFGCSIVIWIFGTYMFTFRGALLPAWSESVETHKVHSELKHDDEYSYTHNA